MKSTLRSTLLTALQAGLLLFLMSATANAADFTVTVPHRAGVGQFQVARVRITLTMQSPAVAGVGGDQVQLLDTPGGVVLGVKTLSASPLGTTVNPPNYRLAFFTGSGNDVIIDVIFFSKFSAMGNFCNSVTAADFTLPLRFNPLNGNTILSHRLSSYSAPGSVVPEQCGCSNRRLNTPGAEWLTPPPGADNGRHPYDVVLVLDNSGSMSDPIPSGIPGSDSAIKFTALKTAVGEFIDVWSVEANAPMDDRLAVVWFESSAVVEAPGSFVTRQTGWNGLKNAVNGKATGDMTAMGDGVSQAMNLFQDNGSDRYIVLLTNGMQNQGNLILPNAAGPPPHIFFNINGGAYANLASMCIPVEAIGFGGVPGDLPIDLLKAMADETGGTAQQPVNSIAAADAFGNSLVNILKGNTMSVHSRKSGTLNSGSTQAPATLFNLDSSVQQAIVVLDWTGTANGLKLDLFRPTGPPGAVFSQQVVTPFYIIKTVEIPKDGPAGEWQALVSRNAGTANLPYHLSIYTLEGRFSSQFDFKKANYGTGDDLILTATLGFGGKPLTGQGNGLAVTVERPESALNNLLHNLQVSESVLTTQPPGVSPDAYTRPYERKVFALLKDPSFGQSIAPKPDPTTFQLLDNGNPTNGDEKAGDGIYSMRYAKSSIPGEYHFKVTMNLTTPTGKVNRFEQHDTQVNVLNIDKDQSEVNSTRELATPGRFRLDIVPADRFGNFLGPGYEDQIQVALVGTGTVAGKVVDERQNGTYTVHLNGVTDRANTLVKVSFNKKEFAVLSLRDAERPKRRFAIFGGLGGNFPHGDFGTFFDPGVSAHGGFEYMFTNRISTEFSAGYERFNFAFGSGHTNMGRASGNIKFYPVIGTFQFGLFGGGGVYVFNSGNVHGGLNLGAVGEYRINTTIGVESAYNFHTVFTNGQNTNYSTLTGGLRFRF